MKSKIIKLPNSQIELKIEIPFQEFEKYIQQAVLALGKDLEIEGFRKGKAPKEVVEKKISQNKILEKAADLAIKENYSRVIDENKIEPLGRSELEILKLAKGNPFEFKIKVFIMPEVKLPDYKKIASGVKKREVSVSKEEIERLRAEKEEIERERLRGEILEKIAEETEVEIPEILIEMEKRQMLEDLKKQVVQVLQIKFEDYLKRINKTEEEILNSFFPEAKKRVKNSLILREIEKKEAISATEEEIKEELDKFLIANPQFKEKTGLDQEKLKSYIKGIVRNKKALQLLENFITSSFNS
jgi:FKBP-type peptidyl-prolyl cis-trans isomerase (trigger factor)